MKTNNKISACILRGSTTALLFSCVLVALCCAINLPEQSAKALPPQDNAAFGANAHQNRTLSFAERVAPLSPIGPHWEIVNSPNNGFGTNQFYATTCASASDCWAVDTPITTVVTKRLSNNGTGLFGILFPRRATAGTTSCMA